MDLVLALTMHGPVPETVSLVRTSALAWLREAMADRVQLDASRKIAFPLTSEMDAAPRKPMRKGDMMFEEWNDWNVDLLRSKINEKQARRRYNM